MDSFEFNKIAMAVLGTVFLVMGLSFASDSIFHAKVPETKGYAIEVASTDTGGGAEEPAGPAFEPISALLASADLAKGEDLARKRCSACHTFEQGGANKAGPALYGIVDKAIASDADFGYSTALTEYGAEKAWTYEELNGFVWKPNRFVRGTAMGFAGLKKVQDRANLVAYLRTLSASPAALPE